MLHPDGALVGHRTLPTSPAAWRTPLAPSRAQRVIAIACLCTWDWLAALCAQAGRPFAAAQARSRQALPGGKATNDTLAAQHIAGRRRGGLWPPASVEPAARRAPRPLRQRRRPRRRQRAALRPPLPPAHRQDTGPGRGQKRAEKATRDGIAEPVPAPAGPPRIAGDLALLDHAAGRRRAMAVTILKPAKPHAAPTRSRRRTVPGMGEMRSLAWRYARHDLARCPRGQAVLSYGRLGQGAPAAAGKRDGTAGTQRGTASLPWEAPQPRCLRAPPRGPHSRARVAQHPGTGPAWTGLAHTVARAGSALWPRRTACARHNFCHA
jgi:hypothetical protein